jgi:hypothetical protein
MGNLLFVGIHFGNGAKFTLHHLDVQFKICQKIHLAQARNLSLLGLQFDHNGISFFTMQKFTLKSLEVCANLQEVYHFVGCNFDHDGKFTLCYAEVHLQHVHFFPATGSSLTAIGKFTFIFELLTHSVFSWAEIIRIEIIRTTIDYENRSNPHTINTNITLVIPQHTIIPHLINLDEPIRNVLALSSALRISKIKLKSFRIWKNIQHEKDAPNQYLFNSISFGTFQRGPEINPPKKYENPRNSKR